MSDTQAYMLAGGSLLCLVAACWAVDPGWLRRVQIRRRSSRRGGWWL